MKIKVWGCRGSIATPGADTLRYGGNTTCVEIRSNDGRIIVIDAGSGARNLGKKLADEDVKEIYLLFTHAHWDHLLGFPFFLPAYRKGCTIYLCGGPNAQDSLKRYLDHQMQAPYFPVDISLLQAHFEFGFANAHGCNIGNLNIESIPINHPNGGYGFKLKEKEISFVFLTDNELAYKHEGGLGVEDYIEFCKNADLLFHDSQYTNEEYETTRGWGHSTYDDVLELAVKAQVKRLGLFHHDPDRTDEQLDNIVLECRTKIKAKDANLDCFAVAEGMEFDL